MRWRLAKVFCRSASSEVAEASCRTCDWDAIRQQLTLAGRTKGGANQAIRELRDFYELDSACLWFTVADGHVYWAFAEPEVVSVTPATADDYSCPRHVRGGWSRMNLAGEPLTTRSISSALLRAASYRMTICRVEHEAYLVRRIRGEADPLHLEAVGLQQQQEALAARMIAQLDWREFETLVDLILARSGWRRTSNVGDGEVDVDLLLLSIPDWHERLRSTDVLIGVANFLREILDKFGSSIG